MPVMPPSIRIGQPPDGPVAQPGRRPRRRDPLVLAAIAVAVGAAGSAAAGILAARHDVAAATPKPSWTSTLGQTMNVRGAIRLHAGQYLVAGDACFGRGGYDDLAPGAQVKVTDESGKVLGVGRITTGAGSVGTGCTLLFNVDNVPRGATFYGIEVAHRGIIQKTEAEILADDVEFTIG